MQLILARDELAELSDNGAAHAAALSSEGGTDFCCYFTSINSDCIYFKLTERNYFQLTVGKH